MAACFLQKRKRAPSLPDSKGSWLVLAVWVEQAEEGRMQGRFCLLRVALTGRCCQRFWNLWNHRRLLQAWTLQGSLLGMKAGRKTTVKTLHNKHSALTPCQQANDFMQCQKILHKLFKWDLGMHAELQTQLPRGTQVSRSVILLFTPANTSFSPRASKSH